MYRLVPIEQHGYVVAWQVEGPGGHIAQFEHYRDADACREALDRECARWARDCLERIDALGGGKAVRG